MNIGGRNQHVTQMQDQELFWSQVYNALILKSPVEINLMRVF